MLNVPMLKLDNNNTYISSQLEQQENNKQLILNIIANINLILNSSSNQDSNTYKSILDSATNYLSTISENIVTLEKLNIEIVTISTELENLQSEENKNKQSKEYLIKAFSNIKNNIAEYTKKFQKAQIKIENDNNKFNEFINVNNFKYNFESVVNDEGIDYKFTGFYMDNETLIDTTAENKYEETLQDLEDTTADIEESEVYMEYLEGENYEIDNEISNIQVPVEITETSENLETNEKIDKLTNDFRKMLINLSNGNINTEKTTDLVSYFQEINELSPNSLTNIEIENINNELTLEETISDTSNIEIETNSDSFIEVPCETTDKDIIAENTNQLGTQETINCSVEPVTLETTPEPATELEIETAVEVKAETEVETEAEVEVKAETEMETEAEAKVEVETEVAKDFGYDFGKTFNVSFIKNNPYVSLTDSESSNSIVTDAIDEIAIQEELINEKLKKIVTATADNETLIISEKTNKIYLPYKISELINYIDNYPNVYSSLSDVVEQEFILPFDYFMKHPYKSRFFETYNLLRNREGRSPITSFANAIKFMHKSNLNPAIIASCKTEEEFKNYIYYLDSNRLEEFKAFNIVYLVNPL